MNNSILIIGNFLSGHKKNRTYAEDLSQQLEQIGYKIITTSKQSNRILRILDMIWTTFSKKKKYQIAIISVFSGASFIWAEATSLVMKLYKKPYILILHGGGLPEFESKHQKRVLNLLQSASTVVTPSNWIASIFKNIRSDIMVIPNAVDISKYTFRKRSNPKPIICWLRAFHNIYQPWMTVEIVEKIIEEFQDVRLILIGPDKNDGSYAKTINLVNKYKLNNVVEFIGQVQKETIPYWLNQGDIFLNTTVYESYGISVVEAAASGLPIVSTNVGELTYMWKDGTDALLFPPDDTQSMAEAVKNILTKPGLSEQLSMNARKKVEGFDWSIVLPQWRELLTNCLDHA